MPQPRPPPPPHPHPHPHPYPRPRSLLLRRLHMAGFCFNTTNTIAPLGNVLRWQTKMRDTLDGMDARSCCSCCIGVDFICHRSTQRWQEQPSTSVDIVTNLINLSKVQSRRRVSNLSPAFPSFPLPPTFPTKCHRIVAHFHLGFLRLTD